MKGLNVLAHSTTLNLVKADKVFVVSVSNDDVRCVVNDVGRRDVGIAELILDDGFCEQQIVPATKNKGFAKTIFLKHDINYRPVFILVVCDDHTI